MKFVFELFRQSRSYNGELRKTNSFRSITLEMNKTRGAQRATGARLSDHFNGRRVSVSSSLAQAGIEIEEDWKPLSAPDDIWHKDELDDFIRNKTESLPSQSWKFHVLVGSWYSDDQVNGYMFDDDRFGVKAN